MDTKHFIDRSPVTSTLSAKSSLLAKSTLLDGKIQIYQPKEGFRVAIDTLLLAAAVPAKPGERLLELGCGVGAASVAVLSRVPLSTCLGLDRDETLLGIAARNVLLNALESRMNLVAGCVGSLSPDVLKTPFDQVFFNPPYFPSGTASLSPNPRKSAANHEDDVSISHWIESSYKALRPKGRITLVHRADRLDDILGAMQKRFGEIRIFPLWPFADRQAGRILVTARKDIKAPLVLLRGLVLHEKGQKYTKEAEAIFREGKTIPLT